MVAQDEAENAAKAEAILAYARVGLPLVPLCALTPHDHKAKPCKTLGKVPARLDWRTTGVGRYGVADLPGNYGVVLTAEWLIVDVDPRNFKLGDNPLRRLVEKIGEVATYAVKTGSGGFHFYFRKPASVNTRVSHPDFPGIDFKSVGAQIVGPGSIHHSGKAYSVVSGTVEETAEAPTALLALVQYVPPSPTTTADNAVVADDAETRGRFLAYLQDTAPPTGSYKVACQGRDLGLSQEVVLEMMFEVWNPKRTSPKSIDELRVKVEHAYTYARGSIGAEAPASDFKVVETPPEPKQFLPAAGEWQTSGQGGRLVKNFHNLLLFFRHPGAGLVNVFGFNEFTNRPEIVRPAPWHNNRLPAARIVTDSDLKMLKAHLVTNHAFEMSLPQIDEAITVASHANPFHPVREYLESLAWDKKERLDTWLCDYLGVVDNPYVRACARKTLCGAIMRVMRPGVKYDQVLVLEGRQGIGKSSVCRILAGEWGGDFPVDPHSKDTIQAMQGRWIVELAELEVVKRSDRQALRAFVTRVKDEVRLPYDRRVGEFPRQSIFIGSINPNASGTYLEDEENRRWWPIACGDKAFDLKGLREVRNQLFAEAMERVKAGEPLFLETKELREIAREETSRRRAEHPWTEKIMSWIKNVQSRPETQRDFFTARDIYVGALDGADKQLDKWSALGIAEVLKSLGYEKATREGLRGWEKKVNLKEALGDLA